MPNIFTTKPKTISPNPEKLFYIELLRATGNVGIWWLFYDAIPVLSQYNSRHYWWRPPNTNLLELSAHQNSTSSSSSTRDPRTPAIKSCTMLSSQFLKSTAMETCCWKRLKKKFENSRIASDFCFPGFCSVSFRLNNFSTCS